jgi:hypothetical protein
MERPQDLSSFYAHLSSFCRPTVFSWADIHLNFHAILTIKCILPCLTSLCNNNNNNNNNDSTIGLRPQTPQNRLKPIRLTIDHPSPSPEQKLMTWGMLQKSQTGSVALHTSWILRHGCSHAKAAGLGSLERGGRISGWREVKLWNFSGSFAGFGSTRLLVVFGLSLFRSRHLQWRIARLGRNHVYSWLRTLCCLEQIGILVNEFCLHSIEVWLRCGTLAD